ncbi:MAG: DUF3108 domain-containing protein [Gemmatimonadaceae bacterium]
MNALAAERISVNQMATDLSDSVVCSTTLGVRQCTRRVRLARACVTAFVIAIATTRAGQIGAQGAATPPVVPGDEQTIACGATGTATASGMMSVPFGVGEKMEYDVKFSALKVGTGTMEVRDITDVRGRPSWHTALTIKGKQLFFFVDILIESWFDTSSLISRRFHQDQRYTGHSKSQTIEIFPERGMMKEDQLEERVTVASPLDDGSLIYFARTLPFEVGKTYSLPCYFKPDANPIKIFVARRETVKTPAGTFKTIVLQPKIKAAGIFGEKSKAEVYITDDSTRMMVKLTSDLTVGSINLFLRKYKVGDHLKP